MTKPDKTNQQRGAILLTGGAGYIGSHITLRLLQSGYEVVIVDDFSNSSPVVIERLHRLTGRCPKVINTDLSMASSLEIITEQLRGIPLWGAIHLAGLKAVGESVQHSSRYYNVNINTTLNLIAVLEQKQAPRIVFSSSATVYSPLNPSPVNENGALGPNNPYGFSKLVNEQILEDHATPRPAWKIVSLRYFNPVGAHASGQIGEDPHGIPNNLFPYIAQVAVGRCQHLTVFGQDYETADGTGVRDYIHVIDLAEAHLASMRFIEEPEAKNMNIFNLGTGSGYSVLQVVNAFSKVSGRDIPVKIGPRREGDIAEIYANPSYANETLDWQASRSLEEMCTDHWRWQSQNPDGYKK